MKPLLLLLLYVATSSQEGELCRTYADCDSGEWCIDAMCTDVDLPHPEAPKDECAKDEDCANEGFCSEGMCFYLDLEFPCKSDDECSKVGYEDCVDGKCQ